MVGIVTWAHEFSPNLYANPLRFGPNYQALYEEQTEHVQANKLRERFRTFAPMVTYFVKQDQALDNRRAKMRTLWTIQNQQFQDEIQDLNNYFNSDNT